MKFSLTAKQDQAFELAHDPTVAGLLMGGSRGCGKSQWGCVTAYELAHQLCKQFNIPVSTEPVPVGFLCRKRGVHFIDTTLETWRSVIPPGAYHLKTQLREIVLFDRVKLHYGGLDAEDATAKLSGAEYVFFWCDEGQEITRDEAGTLRMTLRRKINGQAPHYLEIFTATPPISERGVGYFLRDDYILNPIPSRRFVRALPTDNPYLAPGYIDSIKEAYKHRPEVLRAFLEGSWEFVEGADTVIRLHWIKNAGLHNLIGIPTRRAIGVDVARFGDDETVVYCIENGNIVRESIWGQLDTMQTAGKVHIICQEFSEGGKWKVPIAVDVIGLGAGVVDRLNQMGNMVLAFNSSERAGDGKRFANLKASAWWAVGEAFAEQRFHFTWEEPELLRQLTSVRYDFRNGRTAIEPKDDVKVRLGRSPDRADAYVMGYWALQSAQSLEAQEKAKESGNVLTRRSAVMSAWGT